MDSFAQEVKAKNIGQSNNLIPKFEANQKQKVSQDHKVVDIRGSTVSSNTTEMIEAAAIKCISKKSILFKDSRITRAGGSPATINVRSLPTMMLYDAKGLEIFDKITYNSDYYLTNAEIDILKRYSHDIVRDFLNDGSIIIELGSGAMRKTKYLLDAILHSKKKVTYYAVDLSESSLNESLKPLADAYPTIKFVGLWGTYHDSLEFTRKNFAKETKKMYLWLGSSIGNYNRIEAQEFLSTFCSEGMNDGDMFLCGIDRRNSFEKVSYAYNDRAGLTKEFAFNGLSHLNDLFGFKFLDQANFEYVSIYNEIEGRHEAYFESKIDQTIASENPKCHVKLIKGELINFEYSFKYSAEEVAALVEYAKLGNLGKMTDSENLYDLHV
jgi:EasF-like predicted methyltransferase